MSGVITCELVDMSRKKQTLCAKLMAYGEPNDVQRGSLNLRAVRKFPKSQKEYSMKDHGIIISRNGQQIRAKTQRKQRADRETIHPNTRERIVILGNPFHAMAGCK